MRRTLIALVLAAACTPSPIAELTPTPVVDATPTTVTSPPSGGIGAPTAPSRRIVALGNGLVVELPASWTIGGEQMVNRATYRLLIASNGPLEPLAQRPGNGDVDAAALPAGRVVFEIQWFCRMSCRGPEEETSLPVDWTTATVLYPGISLPADRHELAVGFRWFDQPMFAVARWSDGAADVAEIPRIVASIRPDPVPPPSGEYHGWAAIAPLADVPVGTVRFEPLPPGAVLQQPARTYDTVPFFVVRGKQGIYAFVSRPLHDERCVIHYDIASDRFACTIDGRTYEWTRFGAYLGPEPASDLAQHRVIVRDGIVWVNYARDVLLTPSVPDEAAER